MIGDIEAEIRCRLMTDRILMISKFKGSEARAPCARNFFLFHVFKAVNSGFFSSVWEMKPRRAAHLSLVDAIAGVFVEEVSTRAAGLAAASWAIFFANRSRSPLSIFSRLFNAPGRDFMLLRLMMLT